MSKKINSYKDLKVWQKSMNLVEEIYKVIRKFPKSETYGLVSQMRRAAISIPSNIAEGYRRKHRKEYARFINIASGSGAELETQIEASKRLPETKKLNFNEVDSLLDEVMRMLNALSNKLS